MPRPKSKKELLSLSQENFDKLHDLVDSYSSDQRKAEFSAGTMNRDIKDVLAHLHAWHLMMLKWYELGMKGEKPQMPAEGYTWKTSSDLNRHIWEKYRSAKLKDVRAKLEDSHKRVREIIESHSDKELFEKKRYHWTGSTSLGAYLISSTSSHYDWAFKLIRKAKR